MLGRACILCALTAVFVAVGAADARALPGPPLTQSPAALQASLRCDPGQGAVRRLPVLLVHGALGDGNEWTGNYALVLPQRGFPTCTVTVPGHDLGDLQVAVQYVVSAIRAVHARYGQEIAVIGHSAGSLLSTFALRYWPDLAGDVATFIGLAGVNGYGSDAIRALCDVRCPVAARQIVPGSTFLQAYNSRALYRGPAYTAISTGGDELVTPQPRAGQLAGAENITLQSFCPGRFVDHVDIAFDAAAYGMVMDALTHPGQVVDLARVPASVCSQGLLPGINLLPFGAELGGVLVPDVPPFVQGSASLPAMQCWMTASCSTRRLVPTLVVATSRLSRGGESVAVQLGLPPGALNQCSGTDRVGLVVGRSTVAVRRGAVGVSCAVRFELSGGPTRGAARTRPVAARLIVAYSGDPELAPVTVRRTLVRVDSRRMRRR